MPELAADAVLVRRRDPDKAKRRTTVARSVRLTTKMNSTASGAARFGWKTRGVHCMIHRSRIPRFVCTTVLIAAVLAVAGAARAEPLREAPQRSTGSWKADGRSGSAAQHWQLDLVRDGNRLDGTLVLANSPLARIYGQIDDGGLRGTYRDRTGETGTWSAALP